MFAGDGGGNYLSASIVFPGGKGQTTGIALDSVSSGIHTLVRSVGNVSSLNTTAWTWLAARCWSPGTGICVVQAKAWLTVEPPWPEVTSFNAGDGATATGSDWATLWHVLNRSSYGSTGLVTWWPGASTGSIDYDDFSANELFVLGRASGTDSPVVVPGRKLAAMRTATETTAATASGARKQAALMAATTRDTGQHLPVRLTVVAGGVRIVSPSPSSVRVAVADVCAVVVTGATADVVRLRVATTCRSHPEVEVTVRVLVPQVLSTRTRAACRRRPASAHLLCRPSASVSHDVFPSPDVLADL